MHFANNLRQARKRAGLTQATLAERLGVRRETVACYETEVRQPDIVMLKRIAELLSTTVDDLLATDGPDASEVSVPGAHDIETSSTSAQEVTP